ncbi:MAG: ZIP family metal transporter [Betaproteobacteria bacterium]|nr:ZIP family metal transporter [Betaproteobacteria bacterium]
MDTLLQIILATLAGGVLSMLAAALATLVLLERWLPRLVSFAVGAMLAAAFLDLLPEAVNAGLDVEEAGAVVLGGVMLFFVIEKLALWRHAHGVYHHEPAIRVSGPMVLVGDAVHNFVDGVLIAAAFLQSTELGTAATLAVIAHEVPQEAGDFMVLLHAGYTRRRALVLNALCSLASVVGGVLGYLLLLQMQAAVPYALAISAASFIYIAVADLIPDLHHNHGGRSAVSQLAMIAAGIGLILAGHLLHGQHVH